MNHFNTIIETDRLILRPFTLLDVDASYEMNADPEVVRYTGDGGVKTREEIYSTIREDVLGDYKKYGYGRFAVELKMEQKLIGFSGLKYLDDLKEVDIGYRFMKKYWGFGYATESGKASLKFGTDVLGLKKIIGLVLSPNVGSIHVLKKLGFEYEKDINLDDEQVQQYCWYPKQN